MTTFGPPAVPPPLGPTLDGPRLGAAPWSAAAIGAFVLALLGWIGITAVLGLLFACIALYTTRGGRRRGLGLAIAAIPISLLTGAFAVVVLLAIIVFGRIAMVTNRLEPVFNSSGEPAMQVSALRELTSSEFNEAVGDESLRAWFAQVNNKHGSLTQLAFEPGEGFVVKPDGAVRLSIPGKFVKGDASIHVTFDQDGVWDARIGDIEVDGVSPRGPNAKPPTAP